MCVAWCHRRRTLYWDDENCPPWYCKFSLQYHGRCHDCGHFDGRMCKLTRSVRSPEAGCCHFNVCLTTGKQIVTPQMLRMLGAHPSEDAQDVLQRLDTEFYVDGGIVSVDPDELDVPPIYGIGTGHTVGYLELSSCDLFYEDGEDIAVSPSRVDWLLTLPRFNGHIVRGSNTAVHTPAVADGQSRNEDAIDCTRPRCIRRLPGVLHPWW